ncbi:MAG: hypothetical protein LCI00_19630 [Chloroflexi bacterium]|nr:hypothetical protein [Chloroflexota bacterium]MCC6891387.1 hypothetical protein [Anaerolineae bacterium]
MQNAKTLSGKGKTQPLNRRDAEKDEKRRMQNAKALRSKGAKIFNTKAQWLNGAEKMSKGDYKTQRR